MLRHELIDPKITEHGGRLVKTTGDGLLLEFASVVDAVRCVGEIQAAMAARNVDMPAERRIEFRVGGTSATSSSTVTISSAMA
jgi:adenylate cyclase